MKTQETTDVPDVVTGTFLVNNTYARVLFDSGANRSFISHEFCSLLNVPSVKLNSSVEVETAHGNIIKISNKRLSNNFTRTRHSNGIATHENFWF